MPLVGLLLAAVPARAGVPFVTDDPDTPDKGHFEINLAVQSTHKTGETSGAIPSLEVNYGLLENLELHVLVPVAFDRQSGSNTKIGIGDIELGVKYRFIEADNFGWRPAVAFAPTLTTSTGDESRDLGTGRAHGFLPIWVSEELQKFTVFGGGGYNINPGPGNRNFWFTGLGVTYELTPEVTLGTEIFRTTAATSDGTSSTGFNVGAIYNISDIHHVMFSVGRNITHAAENNQFSSFVAYQITF